MKNNYKAFESFLRDGGVGSPDMYLMSEFEDFSPAAAVNVSYINSFAEKAEPEFAYDLIA